MAYMSGHGGSIDWQTVAGYDEPTWKADILSWTLEYWYKLADVGYLGQSSVTRILGRTDWRGSCRFYPLDSMANTEMAVGRKVRVEFHMNTTDGFYGDAYIDRYRIRTAADSVVIAEASLINLGSDLTHSVGL